MERRRIAILAAVCLTVGLAPPGARADLRLSFDVPLGNSAVPHGRAPWLSALFEDIDANHVRLTLTNHLQSPSAFFSMVKFNVAGDAEDVTLDLPGSGTGFPAYAGFARGNNAFRASSTGRYDLRLWFHTANSGHRFTAGDTLTLVLTRAAGLTADDFAELSTGGVGGAHYAAAHVQGIGANADSLLLGDKVNAVPEPATVLLFGALLAGVGLRMRWR